MTSGARSGWWSIPGSIQSTGRASRWSITSISTRAIGETDVQAEIDRYIAWPSQALGYKVGQLKFLELRAKAQQALGDRFELAPSTTRSLIPAPCRSIPLGERIDSWIAQKKTQK